MFPPSTGQLGSLIGGAYFCIQYNAVSSDLRLSLFIDVQNTYRGAREAYFNNSGPSVSGQFDPEKLGSLIETRDGPNGATCSLTDIRVYTGRPEAVKDPKTYAAHMTQCARLAK